MTHSGQGEYSDVYSQLQPSRIFASLWQLGPICCFLAPSMDGSSLETIFLIVVVLGEQRLQKQTIVQGKNSFCGENEVLGPVSLSFILSSPLASIYGSDLISIFILSLSSMTSGQRQYQKQCILVGLFIWVSGRREGTEMVAGRESDQLRLQLHLYEREK